MTGFPSPTITRRMLTLVALSAVVPGLRDARVSGRMLERAVESADQPVQQGWSVAPDATVRLYVPAGRLTVRTWARDSVALRGTLQANASLFGGGARNHVKVGVEARSSADGALPQATLEVYVPHRSRLWVKMIDGTMSVSGTDVELEAYTVRGRVDVANARGSTTVESIDAPVTLSQVMGDVRVRGSRAEVKLERVQALVSIATVSGNVVLHASPIEGRVETVGGDITLDGVRANGVVTLQSHAGDITLDVPSSAPPRVKAWVRGSLVPRVNGTGFARHGTIDARSFKGTVSLRVSR